MKRILILAVAALSAIFSSCMESDPNMPSITWTGNPKFGVQELSVGADGNITVTAPGKIELLTLTLNLGSYNVLVNNHIAIDGNKYPTAKLPVMDVIDDTESAAFLNGLGISAGASLRGKTTSQIDVIKLFEAITGNMVLNNNSSYTIEINLADKDGNTAKQTATLHFTSAPEVKWATQPDNNDNLVDLTADKIDTRVKINAPGKIAELTVTFESGVKELKDYIERRTTGSKDVIDLVGDSKVTDQFDGFPTGKDVEGKTDVTLDFAFVYKNLVDWSNGTNVFTVFVKDQNGKTGSLTVKLQK